MEHIVLVLFSANRRRGLPAAHPGGHRQDPVHQVGTGPEDLQLHPHVEERGWGVRPDPKDWRGIPPSLPLAPELRLHQRSARRRLIKSSRRVSSVELTSSQKTLRPAPTPSSPLWTELINLRASFTWYHYIVFVYEIIKKETNYRHLFNAP